MKYEGGFKLKPPRKNSFQKAQSYLGYAVNSDYDLC